MTLSVPSLRLRLAFLLPGLATTPFAYAQAPRPHFTPAAAVRAEWERHLPTFNELDLAALPPADRARYERSRLRIGAPGTPDLLPPELARPTVEIWVAKAKVARTPQERFTALHFLNRLKSSQALDALGGLDASAAKTWPKALRLDLPIAAARLNGAVVTPSLQGFLDALVSAGKRDPVRAQAARLRLVDGGREKALLSPVPATPGAVLTLMDAWNRAPVALRGTRFQDLVGHLVPGSPLPVFPDPDPSRNLALGLTGNPGFPVEMLHRLMEGGLPPGDAPARKLAMDLGLTAENGDRRVRLVQLAALNALAAIEPQEGLLTVPPNLRDPLLQAALLPALRKHLPAAADTLRAALLTGTDPVARAAALEDLAVPPTDLEALAARCSQDADLESALTLIQSLDRWKLPAEQQKALLTPFLSHPDWGWRYQAFLQLRKLDAQTPWPQAPTPRPEDAALLAEAQKLATAGRPVRLRIAFSGKRSVILRLDPTIAPLNVANLKRLAERRTFDGRLVPRVVPDFVVQMGSPYDTMDGGPGYTVRCENSLNWYGPGSVGMALSGKDTGGSQFFITTNATPHLTGKYTRLGEVENPDRALKLLDELELGATIESIRVLP